MDPGCGATAGRARRCATTPGARPCRRIPPPHGRYGGKRCSMETIEWLDEPTPGDVEAAAALITEHVREQLPGEPPYPPAELLGHLREQPGDRRTCLVVARDGAVVATAILELTDEDNQHVATVTDFMVAPSERRRGVGGRLLDAISDAARADDRRVLVCYAPDGSAAATAFAASRGARAGLIE